MATDFNKVLLDKGYTQDQINQMRDQVASGQNAKDVLNNMDAQIAKSKTTTTPTTTTSKSEYQGTGGVSGTKTSSYTNQGEGNYVYNPTSGYYEKQGSTTPSTTSTSTSSSISTKDYSSIRDAWNSKTYEEQQELLKKTPSLKDSVVKVGGTIKSAPETTKPETTTTSKDQWDYQDSSEGRMYEIADHLNNYRVTNPNLFQDWDTFSNFFINGKNRSQEQLTYLKDYFNAVKRYNSLDNMTSGTVGGMLARGEVPNDYLNYLKYSDPQRYAEVMDAKDRAEGSIKDSASLDTIKNIDGDGTDTTTGKAIEWLKEQGLFLDKDGNLVDDRRENYASQEEKDYLKKLSDLAADNLDIDNTVKHTYEDYVKKYPGATKATLMAMAQDTNSDLLREKENNLVEMTRLQGYVTYMQSERQEMNKAGAETIAQLEKDYGMYYTYTAEGMSELAQNKYAATNITLDQADEGTDTQKQMALQSVLDGYYENFGDIIQRSEAQVINDVMKLARDKGIPLSQALQENFITPLQNKPQYQALQSGQTSDWKLGQGKNGELFFYDASTQSVVPININGKTEYVDTANRTQRQKAFSSIVDNNTSIHNIGTSIANAFRTGNIGGTCGEFANDFSLAMIGRKVFGDLISEKPVNSQTPTVGSCIVIDWNSNPNATEDQKKYGHVGIVTGVSSDGNTLHIVDSNWSGDGKIKQYDIDLADWRKKGYVKGFYDFQEESGIPQVTQSTYNADREKLYAEIIKQGSSWFTSDSNKDAEALVGMLGVTNASEGYDDALEWWNDNNLKEVTELVNSIDYMIEALNSGAVKSTKPKKFKALDDWKTYFNDDYGDFMTHYDYVYNVLGMKQMQNLKAASVTFGSTTEGEWAKVYSTIAAMDAEKMSVDELSKQLGIVKQELIDTTKGRYVSTNNEFVSPEEMAKGTQNEYKTGGSFGEVFGGN